MSKFIKERINCLKCAPIYLWDHNSVLLLYTEAACPFPVTDRTIKINQIRTKDRLLKK